MKTEDLSLSDFIGVNVRGPFNFEIAKSDSFAVSVTRGWFKHTRAFVDSGTLVIDHPWYDVLGWFTPWVTLRARVEMPELRGLTMSGASRGSIKGFISPGDFELRVRGASRLTGDMIAGDSEFDVVGASRIDLTGSAKALKMRIAGASRFKGTLKADTGDIQVLGASRLTVSGSIGDASIRAAGASRLELASVHNANVKLSGASRCSLDVEDKLDVDVAGASKLVYGGNPVMGDIRSVGASTIDRK